MKPEQWYSRFIIIFPTKIAIWEYTSNFETNQSRNTNSCSSSFQMVQVHFVSIGNVSPLADVQNIWTAVAKACCHRKRKDEQTEQTWTDVICGATNKSTASHMFKAPTSRFFLGMTRVLIIVKFVDWSAHLWRRNEYCSLSAGARCQHAGAHSEGLRICPKMSKDVQNNFRRCEILRLFSDCSPRRSEQSLSSRAPSTRGRWAVRWADGLSHLSHLSPL